LTIAGSDPSGGAGIQADLKTFHRFGVYGEAVVTLLTVQNTVSVRRVECIAPDLVAQQIQAVLEDIPPDAIKLGALGNVGIIEAVAAALAGSTAPLVIDPVMVSKHGAPLMDADAIASFKRLLIPRAFLITPNLPEALALTGEEDPKAAALALAQNGARAVLIKGGHAVGNRSDDLLFHNGWVAFPQERIETPHTHGTGCTLSAAITAELAKGVDLKDAIAHAKAFVTEAIRTAPGLGQGSGPLNHFAN
jgi:hydroxymethylpyrimidine/phosphomethylpyrimidine kinase